MTEKIIQVSSGDKGVIALSDDGRVFRMTTGDFGSVAWVAITPFSDAKVLENPKFQRTRAD